jgi:DNA-binding beta-propeller fold protein YncE
LAMYEKVGWIYVLNKRTGSVKTFYITPFGVSFGARYSTGLGYEGGGYLHMCNGWFSLVAKMHASDGSLISTWTPEPAPWGAALCVANDKEKPGTAYGFFFGLGNSTVSRISFFTMAGSFVTFFSPYFYPANDLAWDYRNEYIWYGHWGVEAGSVVGITPDNSIVRKWAVPRGVDHPNGVAYYGEYLYVCTTEGVPDEYVWVYHCPKASPSVEPVSLGRVKALFR